MEYSIVSYQDVQKNNDSFRIDAEFFKPQYLEVVKKLKERSSLPLKNYIVKITGGATPLGADYFNNGIPFLRVQNIMNNYINDDFIYISDEQNRKIKRSSLKKNDVLLTITGSYGKATVVDQKHVDSNINQHSILIRLKNINPYFLSTFLNSYWGKSQSDRNIIGVTRSALDYKTINDHFLIPLFSNYFQSYIEKIVKKAHELREESKKLYKEAEDLLLEELEFKDWKPKKQLSYIKNFSDTKKAGRIDAEYFQPMYDEILEKIHNVQSNNLGNIVQWSKGIEVGSDQYIDKGIDFIRISDFKVDGINKTAKKINVELYSRLKNNFSIKKGDILFTKDGTIGLTYLVHKNQNAIISGAFLKLKPIINIYSEYLVLVLNSIICNEQIKMLSGGAIILHLKPKDIMNLSIPILSLEKQKEISSKIIESKQKHEQSKSLLEIAKKGVEKAIEENENIASNWIKDEINKIKIVLDSN